MDPGIEGPLLISLFILGILLRVIPHFKYYLPGTSDIFFHFSKIRNPLHGEEELVYPSLFHSTFRIFLKSDQVFAEHKIVTLSFIFDIMTSIGLYLFLRTILGVEIAIIAVLIFLITPAAVIQGTIFSPRSMGFMFLVFSLLGLTLPFPFNFLSVIPTALTMLTHRLATQTLFFIMLGISIFNWQVGLILLLAFGMAIALSKGQYLKILRSHIKAITSYIRGARVPNARWRGLLLVPITIGFIAYLISRVFLGTSLPNLQLEQYLLIWSGVCLLLLIFWFPGESYRYTYYAIIPFAIFTSFLTLLGPVMLLLTAVLIICCLTLSAYFALRFQHLDENIVTLLRQVRELDEPVYFLTPYEILRATHYFTEKDGTFVAFPETTQQAVNEQIKEKKITHIIVDDAHLDWFPNLMQIAHHGKWYLLKTNRTNLN